MTTMSSIARFTIPYIDYIGFLKVVPSEVIIISKHLQSNWKPPGPKKRAHGEIEARALEQMGMVIYTASRLR